MPEDVFATLMPTVLSAGQQGVQNAQQQQNWFQEQQAKAKQVPIEDLARQIKMKELQNEFKNSGNIAALLKQMGQQPGAQQGQTGQQGQQATNPMQAYQNIAQQYQKSAQYTLYQILTTGLKLLHPFMPFVTEEIWTSLAGKKNLLMIEPWPVKK